MKKQSYENSLTSVEVLRENKKNLCSLSMHVAEVLKNQKQIQVLIGTIQILNTKLKQKDKKSNI